MGNAKNVYFGPKNCTGAKRRSFNHASTNSFWGAIRWDMGHLVPAVLEDLAEEAEEGEDGDIREHEGEGAEDEGVQVGGRALLGRNLGVETPGGEPGRGGGHSTWGRRGGKQGSIRNSQSCWLDKLGWLVHPSDRFQIIVGYFLSEPRRGKGFGGQKGTTD